MVYKNGGKGFVLPPLYLSYAFVALVFIVSAKIIVSIALAVQAAMVVYQTPLRAKTGVRIHKNKIGNTSVPKMDVSKERKGRASAVK